MTPTRLWRNAIDRLKPVPQAPETVDPALWGRRFRLPTVPDRDLVACSEKIAVELPDEISPLLGCLCGLAAGAFIAYFAIRRVARPLVCCAPIAALTISAMVLIWSSEVWRAR